MNGTRIVMEEEVEKALDFLRDNARVIGAAKERLVNAEHHLKHIEALEMLRSELASVEARKAAARTTKSYVDATVEEAQAAGAYETLRALREAAAAKIEAWRSEQANYRAMKL